MAHHVENICSVPSSTPIGGKVWNLETIRFLSSSKLVGTGLTWGFAWNWLVELPGTSPEALMFPSSTPVWNWWN